MRRPLRRWTLAVTLAALAALTLGAVARSRPSQAAAPQLIVFASDRVKADPGEIYSLAPGGAPRSIIVRNMPGNPCGACGVAWSPDGGRIAVGGARGIYLVTPGKPGSVRLAIRARSAEYPSFSPDGKQIAFDAFPAHPLGRQTAIMVGERRRHEPARAQRGAVPQQHPSLPATGVEGGAATGSGGRPPRIALQRRELTGARRGVEGEAPAGGFSACGAFFDALACAPSGLPGE